VFPIGVKGNTLPDNGMPHGSAAPGGTGTGFQRKNLGYQVNDIVLQREYYVFKVHVLNNFSVEWTS